jgi:putative hydroxymethylpyrimidine transport system substrate-binding protein
MKKTVAAVAVAAVLGLALPAQAADKLIVLLDWLVNPDHAALVVAKERGDFAARGLDVELIAPADPNDPPKMVAAGQADLGVSYQPQLHLQVAEGMPLVRVGTLIATPLNTVITLADGPIKTVKDLKGKKVGFSVAGFEDAVLVAMLQNAGLNAKDVEMINVNFALSASVLAGQVDAVVGGYRNFELNQMAIEGKAGRAFFPEEEGVPAYDELIVIAHKDKAKDKRIRPFLDAVEAATFYILNHPDDARQLFIKGRPELDDELNRRAWKDTLPRLSHSPAALDPGRYARFAGFLKERGLLTEVRPVPDYAVTVE